MTTQLEISQSEYLIAKSIVFDGMNPRGCRTTFEMHEAYDEARRVVVAYRAKHWPDGVIPDWAR